MVNSELRNQMEHAFMKGDYDEALELSRRLDEQVLDEVKKALVERKDKNKGI